ncbi:MAG: tetratricopeptide repeat protein [Flavobacterium sp.]|uniref:tetratricopeptide repeat protein n=1 Tax=Flavobacterium sp. TaxID=239 RepID=UPI0011FE657B|nr:tetratricopeptide repeat protein [Flavobacterium sp.]RZJ68248.1 MAG: tetratricopeptide repeat protein [Flavobacterium sp.]
MSIKKSILLLLFFVFQFGFSQDYREQFGGFVKASDTVNQLKILQQWEKKNASDPELYVAWFNYYFINAKKEMLHLGDNPEGKEALEITDTTSKKPVGYLYGTDHYDDAKVEKGIAKIDAAIKKFPTRLDMRFGKTYVLGEMKNWSDFTTEIIKTVEYSAKIQNKWTWRDGKPVEDAKNFMLGSIQGYINQLYEANDDLLLDDMKRISETVVKYYPDHVESLSNVSIVLMIQGDFDKALTYLLKAEKLAPNDTVVLGNIAHAYNSKGDSAKAIAYYEKILAIGDENTKAFAKDRIEKIKAKK